MFNDFSHAAAGHQQLAGSCAILCPMIAWRVVRLKETVLCGVHLLTCVQCTRARIYGTFLCIFPNSFVIDMSMDNAHEARVMHAASVPCGGKSISRGARSFQEAKS